MVLVGEYFSLASGNTTPMTRRDAKVNLTTAALKISRKEYGGTTAICVPNKTAAKYPNPYLGIEIVTVLWESV